MMSKTEGVESNGAAEEIYKMAINIRNTLSRVEEECENKIEDLQKRADEEERPLRPEEKAERGIIREIQREARNAQTALTYSTLLLLDEDESVVRIERSGIISQSHILCLTRTARDAILQSHKGG